MKWSYSLPAGLLAAALLLPHAVQLQAAGEDAALSVFPPLTLVDVRDRVSDDEYGTPVLLGSQYTRPADNPVAPGDVYRPRLEAASSGDAVISTVTDRAEPDGSLVLQGAGFEGGAVWMFGQTTKQDGAYAKLSTVSGGADTMTATAQAAAYGMYLVWVQGASGFSAPVRVNAPTVEWAGEALIKAGGEVSLYGRNLSYKNGEETSYVYLRPWGADESAASTPARVTGVNPYKVTFQVPESLPADADYEVWLHNGHGGEYGWAGPQKLRVTKEEAHAWNGKTLDVTAYGATAADGDDDTRAIGAAVSAAADGDILYFPAGNYQISETVLLEKSLHIKGDGADKSVIQTRDGFHERDSGLFRIEHVSSKITDVAFIDRQKSGQTPIFLRYEGKNTKLDENTAILQNCRFEKEPRGTWDEISGSMSAFEYSNFLMEGCSYKIPNGPYFTGCSRVRIVNNDFCGNWVVGDTDGPNMIQLNGPRMIDVSENTFYALDKMTDPDGTLDFGDYGVVRGIVAQLHSRSGKNIYIAGNSSDRVGNPANNCGEVVMFEYPYRFYGDYAVSAQGTDVTLAGQVPGEQILRGAVATIVGGRGAGQSRDIQSVDGSTLRLFTPWTVQPDETSLIQIANVFQNTVVYKNTINGFTNFYEKTNAGAGIQAYGSMINFRAASNTFTNLMTGLRCTPHYNWPSGNVSTDNFAVFTETILENNDIRNVCWGIMMTLAYGNQTNKQETIPAHMSFGTVVRNNRIENARTSDDPVQQGIAGHGITLGTAYKSFAQAPPNPVWVGGWLKNTVLEKNTIKNAALSYIRLQRHQGDTVVRGNTLEGAAQDNGLFYEEGAAEAAEPAQTGALQTVLLPETDGNVGGVRKPASTGKGLSTSLALGLIGGVAGVCAAAVVAAAFLMKRKNTKADKVGKKI